MDQKHQVKNLTKMITEFEKAAKVNCSQLIKKTDVKPAKKTRWEKQMRKMISEFGTHPSSWGRISPKSLQPHNEGRRGFTQHRERQASRK